jgi:phage host-nuclease inhibitor protein Gam
MTTQLLDPAVGRAEVAAGLRTIAAAQVRLARLEAELDERLDAVRRRYDRRVAALRERVLRLTGELEAHCRASRDAILPPGRKSLATTFGVVGFRKAEAVVRLRDELSDEDACRLLRRAGLDGLVRVKEAPDRNAVRRSLLEGRVTGEQLRQCGLELAEGEERFHCKVYSTALEAAAEPGRGRR